MNEIILPVRPKWCELIASGKKTIEARKFCPKCDVPFKVYIYCTIKGDALCPPHLNCTKYAIHRQNNGTITGRCMTEKEKTESDYKYANGKVIGEFVCDRIDEVDVIDSDLLTYITVNGKSNMGISRAACLNVDDFHKYFGDKTGYAWHISDLKIYDEPKQLSEFWKANVVCHRGTQKNDCDGCWDCEITRPPQCFCYVERRREDERVR